ncbi:protein kinase domain-containing protein [Paludisphaera borealis]|uniref:Serine/threonine-protein kinase PknB n=1 Tax=Paludisphaera borealis TaxID=1387353 RepID=A0A1U7CIP3_9BACT|nr:protein kinase [Paludisphaera borealis]APW58801.1 Serine/threonine-protein kinase PknB [Paludisphaera borealis]
MTIAVQCPNPSCGRISQLGEDPLGRIFRCPRCLTKLPAGGASNTDSGWAHVLGPLPRQAPRLGPETAGREFAFSTIRDGHAHAHAHSFDSGEFLAAPFDDDPDDVDVDVDDSRFLLAAASAPMPGGVLASLPAPGLTAVATAAPPRSAPTRRETRELQRATAADTRGLGRFRIVGLLGEGRHATVYRAFDPTLEREVALKLLRAGAPRSARAFERFLGEARALARLRHPRVVSVYEAGRDGDQLYIALALIEGKSLAEVLAETRLSYRRGAEIAAELAEALACAHGFGIVHRDVKPANVRLDAQGEIYLMDFGIAYRPDSGDAPTPPGTILGTPAYIAPEQAVGACSAVVPASDQYSLGAVFYELLCGRPPFCGPPSYVLFHAIHHDPPDPRDIDRHIPRPLADICRKAMAKRPERRYASCQAFAADLRRWLQGAKPQACRRRWFG